MEHHAQPACDNQGPSLRPYQQEDLNLLIHKSAYGVFNEQRTGKTPTSICAAVSQGASKIVMIVPATLLFPWKDEFEKWTGHPCVVYTGSPAQREAALSSWTHGLVINYEMLRAMVQKENGKVVKVIKESMAEALLKMKPDAVIIDEAHRIKDYTSANARAVFKFCNVPFRLALTGTPAPNEQHEVWSILHFLYKKNFPSYWRFIDEWFESSNVFLRTGAIRKPGQLKAGKVTEFQQMLSHISIMRKREEVMPWLPPRPVSDRVRLPLTPVQRRYLDQLEEFFEVDDVITQGILDRIMRYRQICNAPALLGLRGGSPKIDWLKQYMTDYPDRPTIVFSRFAGFIKLIRDEIPGVHIITGDTDNKERQDLINLFQRGKITVLAGQVDTLKEGVTLDTAQCLIFMDVSPPASDISQARDRIVATQEDRAATPKAVIEVMMRDSYDEELYALVDSNAQLIDVINSYKNYLKGGK